LRYRDIPADYPGAVVLNERSVSVRLPELAAGRSYQIHFVIAWGPAQTPDGSENIALEEAMVLAPKRRPEDFILEVAGCR
jgi:hypothetical protein